MGSEGITPLALSTSSAIRQSMDGSGEGYDLLVNMIKSDDFKEAMASGLTDRDIKKLSKSEAVRSFMTQFGMAESTERVEKALRDIIRAAGQENLDQAEERLTQGEEE